MINRHSTWRAAYKQCIAESRRRPFELGTFDCAIFPADVIRAMTGVDIAERYRGRYNDFRSAVEIIRGEGFANHEQMLATWFEQIPVAFATVGDVVSYNVDHAFGVALGVVNGERCFVLREEGLGTLDLLTANAAYKVG